MLRDVFTMSVDAGHHDMPPMRIDVCNPSRREPGLIAFTRSYAVDPESMRAIANVTTLSHTTIMRIADEDRIRGVAFSARKIAEDMLSRLTPQEDPDLYARLSRVAADAREATRS